MYIQGSCLCMSLIVWWTKSNSLDLFPKSVKDQWECEIINYYVTLLPYNSKIFWPLLCPFYEWAWHKLKCLTPSGYQLHCHKSPRNPTWFTRPSLVPRPRPATASDGKLGGAWERGHTRPVFLMRGWGLGTRLISSLIQYPIAASFAQNLHIK